ncbi:MAG TPA: hypothetical protein VNB06_15805 [Thermoanaerobaculia bacterium]|nr:hypothetical protein [Thermoanaerobaculia bacterium]
MLDLREVLAPTEPMELPAQAPEHGDDADQDYADCRRTQRVRAGTPRRRRQCLIDRDAHDHLQGELVERSLGG